MIQIRIVILLLFISLKVNSQPGSVIPSNVRAVNTIERLTDSNGLGTNEMMYGIPLPEGKVIGDTYLDTQWRRSIILLYENNRILEGYPLRYDINTDELDVKTKSGVKVLSGRNVKSFSWLDSIGNKPHFYINAKEYKSNGATLTGFFEVLEDGKMSLLKRTTISIKAADYNVQLSMGSRDDKILKKVVYYYLRDNQIIEVPGNKKKFLTIFNDKAGVIEKYLRTGALSLKKEEDLMQIFNHFNSLN